MKLTTEQQELAARFLPFARALAYPFKRAVPSARQELESAACLALVEAARGFDPGRGVKFITYARHRIRGALRSALRAAAPKGWRSGQEGPPAIFPLTPDSESSGTVLLRTPDRPAGEELELADLLDAWIAGLGPLEATLCRAIHLGGRSQSDAARELGISHSWAYTLHHRALAKLRRTALESRMCG